MAGGILARILVPFTALFQKGPMGLLLAHGMFTNRQKIRRGPRRLVSSRLGLDVGLEIGLKDKAEIGMMGLKYHELFSEVRAQLLHFHCLGLYLQQIQKMGPFGL